MKGLYITCIVDECHNDGIDDLILSSTANIMLQDLIQIGSLFSRFSHDCRIRWPVVTTTNQNKVTFLGDCYLQSKVRVAAVSTRQVTQESSLAWSIKREICVDYAPLSQATRVGRCTQKKLHTCLDEIEIDCLTTSSFEMIPIVSQIGFRHPLRQPFSQCLKITLWSFYSVGTFW